MRRAFLCGFGIRNKTLRDFFRRLLYNRIRKGGENMTNIGKNISSARKKLGITQEGLAEKLNVTRQAVSNWENGKSEPDIETVSKLSEIFGISSDELISDFPEEEKKPRSVIKSRLILSAVFFIIAFFSFLIIILFKSFAETDINNIAQTALLTVRICRPVLCISGVFGILLLISSFKNICIKNPLAKKSLLFAGAIGLGIFLISGLIFIPYSVFIDDLFYRSPALFLMRSPAFVRAAYHTFKFLSENAVLILLFSASFFFGLNEENSKTDKILNKFCKSGKSVVIGTILILFTVLSFLTVELLAPAIQKYASATYDMTVSCFIAYLIVPAAIFALVSGILSIISSAADIRIQNKVLKNIFLVIGTVSVAVILVCNSLSVISIYTFNISEYLGTAEFLKVPWFFEKYRILYFLPPAFLFFGINKSAGGNRFVRNIK